MPLQQQRKPKLVTVMLLHQQAALEQRDGSWRAWRLALPADPAGPPTPAQSPQRRSRGCPDDLTGEAGWGQAEGKYRDHLSTHYLTDLSPSFCCPEQEYNGGKSREVRCYQYHKPRLQSSRTSHSQTTNHRTPRLPKHNTNQGSSCNTHSRHEQQACSVLEWHRKDCAGQIKRMSKTQQVDTQSRHVACTCTSSGPDRL